MHIIYSFLLSKLCCNRRIFFQGMYALAPSGNKTSDLGDGVWRGEKKNDEDEQND